MSVCFAQENDEINFTPTQTKHLKLLVEQLNTVKFLVNDFTNYLKEEYQLDQNAELKPDLSGAIKKKEAEKKEDSRNDGKN